MFTFPYIADDLYTTACYNVDHIVCATIFSKKDTWYLQIIDTAGNTIRYQMKNENIAVATIASLGEYKT